MTDTQTLPETPLEIAELRVALRDAEAKIENLEVALRSSRRIGMANGILMATLRITDTEAFDLLRQVSQSANRKLRDIAEDVIFTGALPITRTARVNAQPERTAGTSGGSAAFSSATQDA